MTFPATVDSTFLKIKSDYWFFFQGLVNLIKIKNQSWILISLELTCYYYYYDCYCCSFDHKSILEKDEFKV